jgi:Yip1 domain
MTPPVATDTPAKSPWWLVLRVLDEPGTVFQELAARPRALIPVILYLVVAFGTIVGMPASVMRSATDAQFQKIEQSHPGAITPDVRERAMARAGSPVARATGFAIAAVFGLLMLAVVAAVLRGVFNGIAAEPISFRQEWAITTHAYVPQILGMVATLVAIVLLKDIQFRFSLGLLFNPDSGGFVYRLANQFTLFGAWNVYLLALGNQVKARGKSIASPLMIVGGLWVVVNLVWAGAQTAMGGMLG